MPRSEWLLESNGSFCYVRRFSKIFAHVETPWLIQHALAFDDAGLPQNISRAEAAPVSSTVTCPLMLVSPARKEYELFERSDAPNAYPLALGLLTHPDRQQSGVGDRGR